MTEHATNRSTFFLAHFVWLRSIAACVIIGCLDRRLRLLPCFRGCTIRRRRRCIVITMYRYYKNRCQQN